MANSSSARSSPRNSCRSLPAEDPLSLSPNKGIGRPSPSPGGGRPPALTLSAAGIGVNFAGVKALSDVDLEIREGEILGLIGPNGAGKTTFLNVLTGYQEPDAGRIELGGEDITDRTPADRCRRGVVRTFQGTRLFGDLSVRENIEVAAISCSRSTAEAEDIAAELLVLLDLTERAESSADSLPYGDERRLSIARALATSPRFLLLDEPAAGLNESESDELLATLQQIHRDYECGLLVVEHDMRLMTRLCPKFQVLDHGATIGLGTPAEMRADEKVLEAYLGSEGVPE